MCECAIIGFALTHSEPCVCVLVCVCMCVCACACVCVSCVFLSVLWSLTAQLDPLFPHGPRVINSNRDDTLAALLSNTGNTVSVDSKVIISTVIGKGRQCFSW